MYAAAVYSLTTIRRLNASISSILARLVSRNGLRRKWKAVILPPVRNARMVRSLWASGVGKACVPCNRPWHEGETCEEYQARTKGNSEEDMSLRKIQRVTKRCPGCRKNIQKSGGCSNMHCSQCRTQFCWNCMNKLNNSGKCACHTRP
ncbi:hypothetical protein EJ03DRAFT_60276 [Teratosphaeria nubilosa]|uniref:RING-type domain-containing protein n=1 Tax=Teratosphaeria nubilosa TaxID=161662 RepID=A0A6G1LCH7_9PEZI|nr:hypothetical protein EJ03DRAFT_60276 [Teratosphaeria nubilosa]